MCRLQFFKVRFALIKLESDEKFKNKRRTVPNYDVIIICNWLVALNRPSPIVYFSRSRGDAPAREFICHVVIRRHSGTPIGIICGGGEGDTARSWASVTPYSSPSPGIARSVRGCLSSGARARAHIVGTSINQTRLTAESKPFRTRPGDSELGRSAVSHGLRSAVNIVQFSVMGPGVERSHVAARCPPITCPSTELPCDFATLRPARFDSYQQFRSFRLQPGRGCYLIEGRYNRSRLNV